MRMRREELTIRALLALEEVVSATGTAPVAKSLLLRFALAYLYATSGGDRSSYDSFWAFVTRPGGGGAEGIGREQNANADLNGIYRSVGVERTHNMMFHRASRTTRHKRGG